MECEFEAAHQRALKIEQQLKRGTYEKQFKLLDILKECSILFREIEPIKRKVFLTTIIEELHKWTIDQPFPFKLVEYASKIISMTIKMHTQNRIYECYNQYINPLFTQLLPYRKYAFIKLIAYT